MKSWILILIRVQENSWIRIRIKVIRIRNLFPSKVRYYGIFGATDISFGSRSGSDIPKEMQSRPDPEHCFCYFYNLRKMVGCRVPKLYSALAMGSANANQSEECVGSRPIPWHLYMASRGKSILFISPRQHMFDIVRILTKKLRNCKYHIVNNVIWNKLNSKLILNLTFQTILIRI